VVCAFSAAALGWLSDLFGLKIRCKGCPIDNDCVFGLRCVLKIFVTGITCWRGPLVPALCRRLCNSSGEIIFSAYGFPVTKVQMIYDPRLDFEKPVRNRFG